jgi:hypothetical protein
MSRWLATVVLGTVVSLHNAQRLAPVALLTELSQRLDVDYLGAGNLFSAFLFGIGQYTGWNSSRSLWKQGPYWSRGGAGAAALGTFCLDRQLLDCRPDDHLSVPKETSGSLRCRFSIPYGHLPIDQNPGNPYWIVMRIDKGRSIFNRDRVKHHKIRFHARP